MSDNVDVNGIKVATSEIGGNHYQRVRNFHEDRSADIWSQHHLPAANAQATATKTAAGAGVRNVCTWLTIKLIGGTTAPAADTATVSVIDGASGGTTYLWRAAIALPATAGADNGIALSGLWLPGTANTGMTIEFDAASGANTLQSVSFGGTTIKE